MGSKVKLGSLLSLLTDYHANGAYKKLKENVELFDEPDYAVMIRTTNFEQNNFDSNLKYISEHAYNFLGKSKVKPGDIIMNKIANAGSSYLMPDINCPVSLAMNLFLLRIDDEKANSTFVYLYLKLNEAYVKSFANGSVTKTITKEAVRNLEIELPERFVQDYIVKVYMNYTNKLSLNKQTNQTLEAMAQALFKSWFVDFDPVFDNMLAKANFTLENLASDLPKALLKRAQTRLLALSDDKKSQLLANKNTTHGAQDATADTAQTSIHQHFPSEFQYNEKLGWLPKGWEIKNIQSCSKKISKGSTPRKKDIAQATGDVSIPFIKVKDISSSGEINLSKLDLIPSCVHENQLKRSILQENDVLFSIAGTIGRVSYVNNILDGSNANQAVAFIRAETIELSLYLYEFLKTEVTQKEIQSKIVQAVQANISLTQLGDIQMVMPPIKLLEKWYRNSSDYFSKIESLRGNNQGLTKLRDTLLPKLISGELQIPELDNLEAQMSKAQ